MISEKKYRKLQKALQLMDEREDELRSDLGDSFDALRGKAEAQVGEYESSQAQDILKRGGGYAEMWTPELRAEREVKRDRAVQEDPGEIRTGPISIGAGAVRGAVQQIGEGTPAGKPVAPVSEKDVPKSWVMSAEEIEKNQAELDRIQAETRDESLPNASKLKAFDAPPQHMGDDLGFEWWLEPTIEEFRRDMRSVYADEVDQFDEETDAYKEYADYRWQKAYEEAKQQNKTLKRVEFSPEVAWPDLAKGLGVATAAAAGADEALLFGGLSRLTGQRANNLALQRRHPTASTLGFVGGALSPKALPNVGVRLLGDATARVAPRAAALLQRSRAATGAAEGATGAGIEQAGLEGLEQVTGERPVDPSGLARRAGGAALTGGLAGGGFGGLQSGAAGVRRLLRRGELGPALKDAEAIGAESLFFTPFRPMRVPESVRDLERRARVAPGRGATAEDVLQGDIERDIGQYVGRQTERYRGAEERLAEGVSDFGAEAGREYDQATRRLESAVAKGGNSELQGAIAEANRVQEIQYNSPEGLTPQPLVPLANAWKKFFANGRIPRINWWDEVSEPMAGENARLTKFAESTWDDIRLLPADEAKSVAGELGGTRPTTGAIIATPREARLYGVNVKRRFDDWFASEYPGTGSEEIRETMWNQFIADPKSATGRRWPKLRFVLSPKFLPARDFDQYIAQQRRGLVQESSKGGKGEIDIPELHQVVEGGAYAVRDQFPAAPRVGGDSVSITRADGSKQRLRGWSAAQHRLSRGIQAAKDRLAYAGLPEAGVPGDRIPAKVEPSLRSAVGVVGTGRNPIQEEAIRRLAATGEGQADLVATDRLRGQAERVGLKLPLPERIPEGEGKLIRSRLAEYSRGEPNETLEGLAITRRLDPQLRELRASRTELGRVGLSPDIDPTDLQKSQASAIRSLARAYRSGAQPEVVERALETALAGTEGEARLKIMLGLKALTELKSASRIGVPLRASSSGQAWLSGVPRLAPLQLRVLDPAARRVLSTPASGVGVAAGRGTEERPVQGKLGKKDKDELRTLRRSLLPSRATLGNL